MTGNNVLFSQLVPLRGKHIPATPTEQDIGTS